MDVAAEACKAAVAGEAVVAVNVSSRLLTSSTRASASLHRMGFEL